ncbi:CLUMA_CG010974, isoform A [Clunio marinus]|uniref:CLUMA_CG010974, isoform A n=1 Tax=Clunio marinus TaxID=568069 RepID=A0A1J1IBJ8_9DIPT|nr:CLUMA_CG010974, isoform A [Clunio marinus]
MLKIFIFCSLIASRNIYNLNNIFQGMAKEGNKLQRKGSSRVENSNLCSYNQTAYKFRLGKNIEKNSV